MGKAKATRTEPKELAAARGTIPEAERLRQANAVDLRLAGATYEEIARALGYANRGAAYKAIHRLLDRVDVDRADDLRALEAARLDRILRGLWVKAIGGDVAAAAEARRNIESRRRLFGIDAPIKIDGRIRTGIEAEIEELCAGLGIGVPPPPNGPESVPGDAAAEVPAE